MCLCLQDSSYKLSNFTFSKFLYFQGTGDANSSILNKGHNDDFLGSSSGKNIIVFISCGVFVRFVRQRYFGGGFNFIGLVRETILSPAV